jgi:GntR family transcriptional regulator
MARFRLESGPVPLHHQVYLDLREALAAGEWRISDRLPAERELAGRYGCSLITVRRALDELSREGRLERAPGRGTFVTEPPIVRDIAARAGFADEMRARGLVPYATVVFAGEEPASPVIAAALGIAAGTPVHSLERVRGADGVPLLLEHAYLPVERFPGLLDEDFTSRSLYEFLAARYGLAVARTRETIDAVVPTAREARLLGLVTRRPVLSLEGTAYARGDDPIEYGRTVVSSERARYYVETAGMRARLLEPVLGSHETDGRNGKQASRA